MASAAFCQAAVPSSSTARAAAEDLREINGRGLRAAILFGPERSGLETDDVALARTILTVPINPQFGSLNLAQAVILVAYEWSKGVALAQPSINPIEPAAPHEELEGMMVKAIEAEKSYAPVPPWPWTPIAAALKYLPGFLTRRMI